MTHINAFYQDVEEARKRLETAQGELEMAEIRLADKQRELGITPEKKPKFVHGGTNQTLSRSAATGRFVSKADVEKNPKTTVTEKRK